MNKIGLFFGSFNPIHIGHLIIAEYMAENSDLKEVWFVVSPNNPFKKREQLLDAHHRLYMVNLAVENDSRFRVSDVEMHLPCPSYTVHTLLKLEEMYPKKQFCIIMGEDNLENISKWKNAEFILEHYPIYVYPRAGHGTNAADLPGGDIHAVNAPYIDISATLIRNSIKQGKRVQYMLPPAVDKHLDDMGFYK